MALDLNLFGAYSHFSGRNENTDRAARYDKVNILGGLFRYEKAKKSVGRQDRERSLEISGLFGAMKYKVDRGNGVKDRLFKIPLYKSETRTLQGDKHSLSHNKVKTFFFFKKENTGYKYDGVAYPGQLPPTDVEKKLDLKERKARNVYGDKFVAESMTRPQGMHKYAIKQSLKAPALNNVQVTAMTTGGIVKASAAAVDSFLEYKKKKQKNDIKWRKRVWKPATVGAVGAALTMGTVATGPLAAVLAGIAVGTYAYDLYRQSKNISDIRTLDAHYHNVLKEVKDFEDTKAHVGAHATVSQERIIGSVENMHFEMDQQLSRRKTENLAEMFAATGASIGIGMSVAKIMPGLDNTMAYVGMATGILPSVFRYGKEREVVNNMQDITENVAYMQQSILHKPITVSPVSGNNNSSTP